MKKIGFFSMAAMCVCVSVCAISNMATEYSTNEKPWEKYSGEIKVIRLSEISDITLLDIMEGKHPEIAVELTKGTIMPIHFFLRGDLLKLVEDEANCGYVEIQQTFFLRSVSVDGELIFSSDLSEWKSFIEFTTGSFTIALSQENGNSSITFGAEGYRRM